MDQRGIGRRVEKRFVYNGREYTIRLVGLSKGVFVEEVIVANGLRGVISGVMFDSQEQALSSAHQLAINLIGE